MTHSKVINCHRHQNVTRLATYFKVTQTSLLYSASGRISGWSHFITRGKIDPDFCDFDVWYE